MTRNVGTTFGRLSLNLFRTQQSALSLSNLQFEVHFYYNYPYYYYTDYNRDTC